MTDFDSPADTPAAHRLARLWAQVADGAAGHGDPVDLNALCRAAARQLQVSAVAVSVPSSGLGAEMIAGYGRLGRVAEELQVTIGEGPSLETLAAGRPLLIGDLAAAESQARWPLFGPAGVAAGVCSLCVVPIRIGAARFGVLAAYLDRPGGLDPDMLADAIGYGAIALELLLDRLDERVAAVQGLLDGEGSDYEPDRRGRRPLEDHPEIHQATGMIAVQLGVDMPTALLRLRARAFTEARLLSELAADVVSRAVRFDDS